ncbi:MAG TPA: hypothetical protein VNE17_12130 [Nitrolancea sp.]|nr:hypothetical protein [Nitrolancea sp.]
MAAAAACWRAMPRITREIREHDNWNTAATRRFVHAWIMEFIEQPGGDLLRG